MSEEMLGKDIGDSTGMRQSTVSALVVLQEEVQDLSRIIKELRTENARLKHHLSPKPEPEPPRPRKACPWCGREPCSKADHGHDYSIKCQNPDCPVFAQTLTFGSMEKAIEAWDTRAGEED